MTQEVMIQKIKDRIEYHADTKKYGYFIGSGIMDYLAADILKDLQIADLTARAEKAEAKLKEAITDMKVMALAMRESDIKEITEMLTEIYKETKEGNE